MRSLFKLLLLIPIACCQRGEYYSAHKIESGVVVAKQFTPEINASGSGVGISSNGDPVVTINDLHEREHFRIVFQCEHGNIFTIERKDLFPTLNTGDTVSITYREIYDRDSMVVDYDFITAKKR